jgi:hypothetical protein
LEKELVQTIRWNATRRLEVRFLSLEKIDEYFKILQFLYTDFRRSFSGLREKYPGYNNFNLLSDNWLKPEQGGISQIECFVLLPVLYYCQKKQTSKHEDAHTLFRIIRFFFNLSSNETIKKTAPERCLDAFDLVQNLPEKDICSILDEADKISKTILSNEEATKLKMYQNPEFDSVREEYETLFWQGEDTRLSDGSISHLIDLAKEEVDESNSFLDLFRRNLHFYKELINNEEEIWGNLISTSVYIVP